MGRRPRKPIKPRIEPLEARVNLGYTSAGPGDEIPMPALPGPCPIPPPPTVSNNGANTGQGPAYYTKNPIRAFDGMPSITATDIQTDTQAFGFAWGIDRTWSGLNNSGPVGNGWVIDQLPYVVVAGGYYGANTPGGTPGGFSPPSGTGDDDRLEVIEGGTSAFTFSSSAGTSYAAWGAGVERLEQIPGATPLLRLTDSGGNVTDFYDVRRDAGNMPLATSNAVSVSSLYGRFKSYKPAGGTVNVSAGYAADGSLSTVTLIDTASGASEQYAFAYAPVTNDLVTRAGGPVASQVSGITIQRPDGSGGWDPVQRSLYTYYTGLLPDGSGGFMNDPNGRLGDLQKVVVSDAVAAGGWQDVDSYYYRYYKLTGESNQHVSYGPTNTPRTTGGPAPIQPSQVGYSPDSTYDPADPFTRPPTTTSSSAGSRRSSGDVT
jgi:hypothetical protein